MEEELQGQDHNEHEESSGTKRGAEQLILSTLMDTLVERVVEKVREPLAPLPSSNPAVSSASPVTSEGMTGTIFEYLFQGNGCYALATYICEGQTYGEGC